MALKISNSNFSVVSRLKDKFNLKVGNIVTCSFMILKKKKTSRVYFDRNTRFKRYFWSVVHFSGICISLKRGSVAVFQNYSGLNSFTFTCFLNSPNLVNFLVWDRFVKISKRSLKFTTRIHKKIIKRLKFI